MTSRKLKENWKFIVSVGTVILFIIAQIALAISWKVNLERDIQERPTTAKVHTIVDSTVDRRVREIKEDTHEIKADINSIKLLLINQSAKAARKTKF